MVFPSAVPILSKFQNFKNLILISKFFWQILVQSHESWNFQHSWYFRSDLCISHSVSTTFPLTFDTFTSIYISGYLVMVRCSVLISLTVLMSRKLLLVRCSSSSAMRLEAVSSTSTSFWLTVEPVSVEWANGCLAAAGCADSRLALFQWNLVSDERISSSWSIHEHFVSGFLNFHFWIHFNWNFHGKNISQAVCWI